MTMWAKRVFLGALVGATAGVLLGLGLARLIWPPAPQPAPSPAVPAVLPTPSPRPTRTRTAPVAEVREELIVLASALYALDGDVQRARQRLAVLGAENAAGIAADLALRYASQDNRQVAADLAALSLALGAADPELAAYANTARPAASPTASPTAAPSLTPVDTPSPEPSSTATASPESSATSSPSPPPTQSVATRRPPTATPVPSPVATPRPLVWDERVDDLDPPVKLVEAEVAAGERYWRLVRQEWRRAVDGGNMLLYINALDETGQPVWGQEVIIENGGHTALYTTPKPGEAYGVNFVMSGTLGSYQAFVGGALPSDRVVGLGLGERYGWTEHSTFMLEYQLAKK
jgi:hypothetical protein